MIHRRIGILLGVLALGAACYSQASAEDKADTRKEEFQNLQKEWGKINSELGKEYGEAKTEKERKEILAKLPKLSGEMTAKLMKLAETDPKSDLSFDILMWTSSRLRPEVSTPYDLLATNFAKSEKMVSVTQMMMNGAPKQAKNLLETVLNNNSDEKAKGYACYALANMLYSQAETAGNQKQAKEAEVYFERVVKDFADVPLGKKKLAERAEGMLKEIRTLGIGMTAPATEGKTLEDKAVKLDSYKGKVVVLDIWATWCGPCRAMIPHEREMVEALKDKPFALISVSADEKKETLEKFLEKEKMPWQHWWAGQEGEIMKTFNVRFFPTVYVIDAKGVIRYKNIRGEELEKAVKKLIEEAGSK